MTDDEQYADEKLIEAKDLIKLGFGALNPAPKEPSAVAILAVLDSIDAARKALKERMPA
jgi:hypothetical protein